MSEAKIGHGTPTWQPHNVWIRDPQRWAVDQEVMRHNQALYYYGEYVMIYLMWHLEDFEAGLVKRCQTCYLAAGPVAEVYEQPTKRRCPDCYGTSFEKGIRAAVIRPAIITDTDEAEQIDRRGITFPSSISIETTVDIRIRNNDYMLRQDGSRWQLRTPSRTTLRTGFEHPSQANTMIYYTAAQANLEDESSVAYDMPPTEEELRAAIAGQRYLPNNNYTIEIHNGPLIPPARED